MNKKAGAPPWILEESPLAYGFGDRTLYSSICSWSNLTAVLLNLVSSPGRSSAGAETLSVFVSVSAGVFRKHADAASTAAASPTTAIYLFSIIIFPPDIVQLR